MASKPKKNSLVYKVTKAQHEFVTAEEDVVLFVGGIGSGKTYAGALRCMRFFTDTTPRTGIVVAPTYRMLVDVVERTCLELWNPIEYHRTLHYMRVGPHLVLFRSADEPDRLRGINASWVWVDEAALVRKDVWLILLGRLREHGERGKAWLTTTPKGKNNWVHEVAHQPGVRVVHARTLDNVFIDESFVEMLRQEYTDKFQRQELEGEFVDMDDALIDVSRIQWIDGVDESEVVDSVRYWDLAVSTRSTADYTASVRVVRLRDGRYVATAPIRRRIPYPELRELIVQTHLAEPSTRVYVEANAFQLAAVQDLQSDPRVGFVEPLVVDRDKASRAMPWVARLEQGVLVFDSLYDWRDWFREFSQFPEGEHDDTVDALSGAFLALSKPRRKLEVW